LKTEIFRAEVEIRADLAWKLADKAKSLYQSWVADFMEEQGYPAITIAASGDNDGRRIEIVAFDKDIADEMAIVLKKRLLCANVPCEKCSKHDLDSGAKLWIAWEKKYLVVINRIDSSRKIEVYGILKDVIEVVEMMNDWVHKNSRRY